MASLGLASSSLVADGRMERTWLASLSREVLWSCPRTLRDFGVGGGRLAYRRAGRAGRPVDFILWGHLLEGVFSSQRFLSL